jgi:hypothetical protein
VKPNALLLGLLFFPVLFFYFVLFQLFVFLRHGRRRVASGINV